MLRDFKEYRGREWNSDKSIENPIPVIPGYDGNNIISVTVCRRLSRVFICLFGSVGSFRVRVFVVVVL